MNTFYEHHHSSIRFTYRCFDRILLNALIQPFQQPERVVGFFNTYRQLYPVSKAVLCDIASQYQHWVTARAIQWGVPLVDAPAAERRDTFVEPYFRRAAADQVVVILKASLKPGNRLATSSPSAKTTAGIWSSSGAGRSSTISISLTASGAACSSASARTFRSRRACVSISITGWPAGWKPRASPFGKPATCS